MTKKFRLGLQFTVLLTGMQTPEVVARIFASGSRTAPK